MTEQANGAMELKDLLVNFVDSSQLPAVMVHGLALDSRAVERGDCFFAYQGLSHDGREYIQDAIDRGANAIVYEAGNQQDLATAPCPMIAIPDLAAKLGLIASQFYHHPSQRCPIVAVTGTNGKTTLVHFVAQMLAMQGKRCAVLGTVGNGFLNDLQARPLTTDNPLLLQRDLYEFNEQGADVIALEASSHALSQNRLNGTDINVAVWTNLSRDHLDYHADMDDYFKAKRRLFTFDSLQYAVINLDDPYAACLLEMMDKDIQCIGYSIHGKRPKQDLPYLCVDHITANESGLRATIHSPWGVGILQVGLIGRFNLSNVLAALACAVWLGNDFYQTLSKLCQLTSVPGRMQCFSKPGYPRVVVDYAHSPQALDNVLAEVNALCDGSVWCVFGCGGDRDKGKRAQMGKIAEQHGVNIILTDDNPRSENPGSIVDDIRAGISDQTSVVVEHRRKYAIEMAINQAQSWDWVVVAGKGHEQVQQIGACHTAFSDIEQVQRVLAKEDRS